MLLNLVRLKYHESPYFLKVGSVTASLTLEGSIGIDSSIDLKPGSNIVKPNLGISYSDRPTISYTPLQGEDFLKNILSSISLEALLVMTQSGWSVERVFGLCIERMNNLHNAPSASGPTPDSAPKYQAFKRMLTLFRQLYQAGSLEIGLNQTSNSDMAELILLFKSQSINQQVYNELNQLLGFKQTQKKPFTGQTRISTNFLNQESDQLTVRTRSIASVLFYLSQNIDIPKPHIDAGLVTITKTPEGKLFNWGDTPVGSVFKIRSSETFPKHAFLAVAYRDYWYYIADNDLHSKSTFLLLTQLFALQAGQTQFSGPTLTLPVR
jgi:hypothetical protein